MALGRIKALTLFSPYLLACIFRTHGRPSAQCARWRCQRFCCGSRRRCPSSCPWCPLSQASCWLRSQRSTLTLSVRDLACLVVPFLGSEVLAVSMGVCGSGDLCESCIMCFAGEICNLVVHASLVHSMEPPLYVVQTRPHCLGCSVGMIAALTSTVLFAVQNIYSKKIMRQRTLDHMNLLYQSTRVSFILFFPFWAFTGVCVCVCVWSPVVTAGERAHRALAPVSRFDFCVDGCPGLRGH